MGSRNRYKSRIPRYNIYGIEQREPTSWELFQDKRQAEGKAFREKLDANVQQMRNEFWTGNKEGIQTKVKGRRQILEEEANARQLARDQEVQSQSPKIKNIPQSQLTDQQKINQDLHGYTPSAGFVNPFPNAGNEKLWGTSNEPGREGQYLTSDGQIIQLQSPAVQDSEKIDKASIEVVDKSNDTKTVVENQEKAQGEDAPGSDAERNKALGYNTSLAGQEAVYDSKTGTMKIPGQDELNKSANERLDQEQRTPNDPNKGQTDQPNPNAAMQNFDKIAGAIHGLATIAKALDTGEFTPPRTPSSWDNKTAGTKLAEASTVDPDDPDKNRWRRI